jgi:hypothetical protein
MLIFWKVSPPFQVSQALVTEYHPVTGMRSSCAIEEGAEMQASVYDSHICGVCQATEALKITQRPSALDFDAQAPENSGCA